MFAEVNCSPAVVNSDELISPPTIGWDLSNSSTLNPGGNVLNFLVQRVRTGNHHRGERTLGMWIFFSWEI